MTEGRKHSYAMPVLAIIVWAVWHQPGQQAFSPCLCRLSFHSVFISPASHYALHSVRACCPPLCRQHTTCSSLARHLRTFLPYTPTWVGVAPSAVRGETYAAQLRGGLATPPLASAFTRLAYRATRFLSYGWCFLTLQNAPQAWRHKRAWTRKTPWRAYGGMVRRARACHTFYMTHGLLCWVRFAL